MSERTLRAAPSLLPLFVRAGAAVIPGASRLPFVGGAGGRTGGPVPDTVLVLGDLGRRYGAVSGDLNPIHVHPLTARLFGFPSAIAHGMWTLARCLAALGPGGGATAGTGGPVTIEVAFRKPIALPATVQFAEARSADGIRFGVRDARRQTPHLDGLVSVG
jgi:acyl dehydratase